MNRPCQMYYNLGAELSEDEEDEDGGQQNGELGEDHRYIEDRTKDRFKAPEINPANSEPKVVNDSRTENSEFSLKPGKTGEDRNQDRSEWNRGRCGEVWNRGSVPPDLVASAERFRVIKEEPRKMADLAQVILQHNETNIFFYN